jgi:hypothetical protein
VLIAGFSGLVDSCHAGFSLSWAVARAACSATLLPSTRTREGPIEIIVLETTMKRPILYQALLGACLAVSVGGLAAQTGVVSSGNSSTGPSASAQDQTSAKQEPAAQPNEAQMKNAPPHTTKAKAHSHTAKVKSHSHTAKAKSHSHTAKAKSPQHTAKAKSPQHTAKAKSPQHMARAKTEESSSPDAQAYRQALRGCVTQKDESRRDTCLDQTIEKFHRNA